MKLYIKVNKKSDKIYEFDNLEKKIKIGRNKLNDITLNDPLVSHQHCELIQLNEDEITIKNISASGFKF